MEQRTKKLGMLSAGILLALGWAAMPQQAQAYTLVSGTAIGTGTVSYPSVAGNYDVAVGDGAQALSVPETYAGSTAVGTGSYAYGDRTAAFGTFAQVLKYDPTVTDGKYTSVNNASAIGSYAKAFAENATAVGGSATSYGTGSTAVGYYAICAQFDSKGNLTEAVDYATALGATSQALKEGATAVGYGASAQGEDSIAIGHLATFTDTTTEEERYLSVATGKGSITLMGTSTGESAVSIGHAAFAVGNDSVALGSESQVAGKDGSAIGSGAISYSKGASALGAESQANGEQSTSVGYYSVANGKDATALGAGSIAYNEGSLALGAYAKTGYFTYNAEKQTWEQVAGDYGQHAIAMGYSANAVGNKSIAIGYGALAGDGETSAANATAVGLGAGALGDLSTALGGGTMVQTGAHASLAVGTNAFVLADKSYATALGFEAQAQEKGAFALGYQAVAATEQAYENISTGEQAIVSTVSFGHQATDVAYKMPEGGTSYVSKEYGNIALSRLTNIANGKELTDGAAYGQLIDAQATETDASTGKVTKVNAYEFDDDGYVEVKNNEGGIAFALQLSESSSGGASSKTIGDTTKLADAGLGDNVTDSILSVNDKVDSLSDDINKVGAGAAALAALRPEAFDPMDKWSFAVGYGHYKSANAGALGAFFKPNADTTISFGSTIGNGNPMMNAGVSFKLGQRGKGVNAYRTDAQVAQELASLRKNNEQLTAQNTAQQQEISALRADNQRMKQQIEMILSKLDMSGKVSRTVG